MEDERTPIQRIQAMAKSAFGKELTPDEMATEFARMPITDRIAQMDEIDRERASGEPLSIREAARQRTFTSKLRHVHETLRKVGR